MVVGECCSVLCGARSTCVDIRRRVFWFEDSLEGRGCVDVVLLRSFDGYFKRFFACGNSPNNEKRIKLKLPTWRGGSRR